jgi:ATP-dependent DNA helicase RecG
MLEAVIAETTDCDFKAAVEIKKPKSWLKSVSAFANGIGGTLIFGIADDKTVVGIEDIKNDTEAISRLIKERITPIPEFQMTAEKENGADIILLKIHSGITTPYYYSADGIKQAFIRLGNESINAPDHILNELILKGTHRTFDVSKSNHLKADYSFTLMEATYFERTKNKFEGTDYLSFGLVENDGYLTVAGALMADQHIVYNSRAFCTRWNGLQKGSVIDGDAADDKEYSGNLIYLLNNICDFIRNNSKIKFKKEARYRVDQPDYADRAVTEAVVNALIHRDYIIMGAEIHVDMYDDRVEIISPGGMYEGTFIQNMDVANISSSRRNPVIADLFHRMKFMERRGSGLNKIVTETTKLSGYSDKYKPAFISTPTEFKVILKNVNYRNDTQNVPLNVPANVPVNVRLNSTEKMIFEAIKADENVTYEQLAEITAKTRKTVMRNIKSLKSKNLIQREGADKNGKWVIISQ